MSAADRGGIDEDTMDLLARFTALRLSIAEGEAFGPGGPGPRQIRKWQEELEEVSRPLIAMGLVRKV